MAIIDKGFSDALREIVARENENVGFKEYAAHIRKGGADDLAAKCSMAIAQSAYELNYNNKMQRFYDVFTGIIIALAGVAWVSPYLPNHGAAIAFTFMAVLLIGTGLMTRRAKL